jgi:2-phosphoglycerate kinase
MKSWKVLLIGGSSGVGKSHLARQLSDYYKVPLLELDDIRIALQQVVKETDHPDLFTFINTKNFYEKFNDQEFVLNLLGVGAVVWKALDVLISKHIACDEPIIIEGDGIIPKLLFQRNQDYIKSIFLHDSIDSIKERQLKRDRLGG